MTQHLLIIDDEPVLRLTFRYFLEQNGYEVRVAESGHEGLELCRQQLPAVVITDLCMPGMSGYEIIEALRAEAPRLPIIAMSAVADSCGRQHTLACGATCCVTKPLDMKVLLRLVDSLVNGSTPGEGE